jgi:cytochrome c oxidase subunit 2
MHNFVDELRGDHPDDLPGHQMNLITPMFRNDATIKNVSEYVETLKPGAPPMTRGRGENARPEPTERPFTWESNYAFLDVEISAGNADSGKRSFQQYCIACHGPDATGIEALGSPPLANLADWYMARQLQYFRNGVRGTNPKDIYGAQMAAFGRVLADDQAIADVIAYIKTLTP